MHAKSACCSVVPPVAMRGATPSPIPSTIPEIRSSAHTMNSLSGGSSHVCCAAASSWRVRVISCTLRE